jgi:hypothetical protein
MHFTDPLVLVQLHHHLTALNKEKVFEGILRQVLLSTCSLGAKAPSLYLKMILPLAKELLQSPPETAGQDPAASLSNTHAHFNTIWRYVLLYFLGQVPASPSFAMPPLDCRCRDCAIVNRFLASAHQMQLKFPADKYRRQHLHQEVRPFSLQYSDSRDATGRLSGVAHHHQEVGREIEKSTCSVGQKGSSSKGELAQYP